MRPSRGAVAPGVLFALVACLLPACAQEAEPEKAEAPEIEEDASDLWSGIQLLYEKAKEAGEQVPGSTVEWVREDLDRIGDWEYRVVVLTGSAEQMEEELNELGRERWECFSVQADGTSTRFFFKRSSRSYLASIPVTSLIKLLPGVGGDGGSSE